MVYRSTHHHTVRYAKGEKVLWVGEPAVVTEGGFLLGAITIEWRGREVKFGPYDMLWPEKILTPPTPPGTLPG